MRTFKELLNSIKTGEELYEFSLQKAKRESHGDSKMFTKLSSAFTGKSKPKLKKCRIFQRILEKEFDI